VLAGEVVAFNEKGLISFQRSASDARC